MATMADSLVNSAMRPLKLRKRADLECRRNQYDGRTYWVVKEPVGLNYFRFHEEEFEILQMLDGETSLQTIREAFQAKFRSAANHTSRSSAIHRYATPKWSGYIPVTRPGSATTTTR